MVGGSEDFKTDETGALISRLEAKVSQVHFHRNTIREELRGSVLEKRGGCPTYVTIRGQDGSGR